MFTVPIARVVAATSWLCLSLTHAQYVQFLHCMYLFATGVRDNNGRSPLDSALDGNDQFGSRVDVALYLINLGMCGFLTICTGVFTAGVRDDKGHSPLAIAIMSKNQFTDSGCADIALYLMNHGCTCSNEDKAKLLCKACSRGNLDMVKELVEQHKVDPNGEHYYMTVLYNLPMVCTLFWFATSFYLD